MLLNRGKTTNVKYVPTTDEDDDEYGSGHPFPKANRRKGMNRDNRIPKSY